MDEAAALEALANTLTLLMDNPYDLSLHIQHVRLARETGMEDQVEAALDMLVTFWAAGEDVWIPYIDSKLKSVDLDSVEGVTSVLKLFEKAEADYLSIPILKKHLEFTLERFAHVREPESTSTELKELFSLEWVQAQVDNIVSQGAAHLTQGQELWVLRRDWEAEMLEEASDGEKPELVARIEAQLLERLKHPHANNDETLQSYSSFTTNHKPADQYEALLVQASKSRSQAVKVYQRRESYESSLAQAGYSLEGYAYYLEYEKRGKKPDLSLLFTLYERAITEADKRRFAGNASAEAALRTFWIGYLDLLRTNEDEVDEDTRAKVYTRATRSVPGSGDVWARYIRFLERTERGEAIDAAVETALMATLVGSDVEQLVPVILAKASFERRKVEREEMGNEGYEGVLLPLLEGQSLIREKIKTGDPRLRLEKYFSALCLETASLSDEAVNMWSAAVRHYKTSYLAWTAYTDVLIRLSMFDEARKVFRDVSNKNLDWPEAIWEAWLAFEHVHGSIEELEDCMDRIDRAQKHVNAKRAKEAEKAALTAMQVDAELKASVDVANAPVPEVPQLTGTAPENGQMDVDQGSAAESSTKRKAEEDVEPEGHKKAKIDAPSAPMKRDRENSTVFVADLPPNTSDDDLKALFKDCGPIREVKITPLPNALVATVEFMDRDSVPAALTKDKKRVHGEEIAVHLAWQSTLYVANFPESADDQFIRDLFGKYGVLFDVRWPSKKFKNTRRFCYVQYTSPGSAQAATILHNGELEPGLRLTALISNPQKRKERTDADANDRELYVAGLARSVTKYDLEKLFTTYGTVKEVRMALDEKGQPKGFAFVEFEQEKDALAALAANNHELKKRRIAVTLADTRVKASKTRIGGKPSQEVRNRSVRIRGLPAGTQEGLLQQTLEKYARVQRVEVFKDANEAVAQLENPAEAGKLLLHPDPIVFNSHTLQLSEESLESSAPGSTSRSTAPSGGLFMPRSAGPRPRAGLGSKKARPVIASTSASSSASSNVPSGPAKGQDDFRKMLG